jgi:hypothetical protein
MTCGFPSKWRTQRRREIEPPADSVEEPSGNGPVRNGTGKPSVIAPEHRFQIATYAQLTPGACGHARIDTLVKMKTPGLVTQRFTITEQDVLATQELYPLAQTVMRSELYIPTDCRSTAPGEVALFGGLPFRAVLNVPEKLYVF